MPPQYVRDNLAEAVLSDNVMANQYTRSFVSKDFMYKLYCMSGILFKTTYFLIYM